MWRFEMLVLGIETTCDETAIAVVKNGKEILSNVISSQIELHRPFKGVFPEYASRSHVDLFLPTLELALKKAAISLTDIDLIAVASEPGLMGSILIGLNGAKALSFSLDIPYVAVNHLEAHLYGSIMSLDKEPEYPALGVVLSGGHTFMVKMLSSEKFEMIASTVDDAIGESFDKVAALLSLPYPGGPEIEKLALLGDSTKYPFKAGKVKDNALAFSFSGLKTQVLYAVKGQSSNKSSPSIIEESEKKHIAASFQMTALSDVVMKAIKAAELIGCRQIFLGGGVTSSSKLKELFRLHVPPTISLHFPGPNLSIDNGAMIAGLGYHKYLTHLECDSYATSATPSGAFSSTLCNF
jgi:N6-L-threonylcarbamoyladenine synthase